MAAKFPRGRFEISANSFSRTSRLKREGKRLSKGVFLRKRGKEGEEEEGRRITSASWRIETSVEGSTETLPRLSSYSHPHHHNVVAGGSASVQSRSCGIYTVRSLSLTHVLGTSTYCVQPGANIYIFRPIAANSANYATLREIEGRLKSIRNIEKITKTMKIVASTKLTRAQRAMTESRSYGQSSNMVYEGAETKAIQSEDKKTLIVVASSDKGLCGGIHSGLSKATRRLLEEKPNSDILIIGEKSKSQLSRSSGKNIVLSFAGVGRDVPTFADAQAIADQISQLPTEYSDIRILYNKFLNAQSYEATSIEVFSEEAFVNSRESP